MRYIFQAAYPEYISRHQMQLIITKLYKQTMSLHQKQSSN